jgi:N-carbamoylputrescine amidase
MTAQPFTIGAIQMRYAGSPEKSLAHACAMLEQAAAQGVQVACLPELFLTDYFCQRIDPANFDLAEPLDGKTVKTLQAVAKKTGMVIVGSIFEKAAAGLHYNTAVIIEKTGETVGVYRKMHIPHDPLFEEKYYFAPGDLGFKTHPTSAGKIGALVCWDQWYPEGARLTAMQGADVLFYPTAIGWLPKEKAEFGESQVSAWETIQRAHAIANGVYVCAVNRIGHEGAKDGGIEFFGHSFICDPFGRMLAVASHDKEEILVAKVDPAWNEQTRRWWPFFRDRRVDAYGGISQRWPDKN